MVRSNASSVEDYLGELPDARSEAIAEVREVILANLGDGFVETMNWGMISYEVPLETFPDTYNGKPLMLAALANQKRHMAVYLTSVYADPETLEWFTERYRETGKKMDMGKSCVRFSALEHLPVALIGEAIARVDLETFLDYHRASHG